MAMMTYENIFFYPTTTVSHTLPHTATLRPVINESTRVLFFYQKSVHLVYLERTSFIFYPATIKNIVKQHVMLVLRVLKSHETKIKP